MDGLTLLHHRLHQLLCGLQCLSKDCPRFFEGHAMCNKCRRTAYTFHSRRAADPTWEFPMTIHSTRLRTLKTWKARYISISWGGLFLLPVVDSAVLLAVVCSLLTGQQVEGSRRQHTQQTEAQGLVSLWRARRPLCFRGEDAVQLTWHLGQCLPPTPWSAGNGSTVSTRTMSRDAPLEVIPGCGSDHFLFDELWVTFQHFCPSVLHSETKDWPHFGLVSEVVETTP